MDLCVKCQTRPKVRGLLCGLCRKAQDTKPAVRAWERPEKQPLHDWWRVAQNLLYPNRTYASLVKPERYRVTEMARRLAGSTYREAVPVMDAEFDRIYNEWISPPPEPDNDGQYSLELE